MKRDMSGQARNEGLEKNGGKSRVTYGPVGGDRRRGKGGIKACCLVVFHLRQRV